MENLVKLVTKEIAKRKGLDEEKTNMLLEALKEDDTSEMIKNAFANYVDMAKTASELPDPAKPFALPFLMQASIPGLASKDDIAKTVEKLAVISAAIRAATGDDSSSKLIESLQEQIREQKRMIEELREEKLRKEQEAIVNTFSENFKEIQENVSRLEKKIEEIEVRKESEKKVEVEKKEDDIDTLTKLLEKLKKNVTVAKELGLIKDKDGEEFDVKKAEEVLRKMGYKVEPPMGWEQFKKYLDEKMKEIREQAKKEAMEELEVEEKRLSLVTDFLSSIVGAAIEAFSGGSERSGLAQGVKAAKEAFDRWRTTKSEIEEVKKEK